MEWYLILTLMLGALISLMLAATPVAYAFLLVGLSAQFLLQGWNGLQGILWSINSTVGSFNMVPIPLFVLMGILLWRSGLGSDAVGALDKLLGRLPARLSFLTLASGGTFSALSGSTIANTAMLGSMLLPELRSRKYSNDLSIGVIVASGGLAMMIPPSSLAILLAAIGNLSVAKVLIGAAVPGFMMMVSYAIYILVRAKISKGAAPYAEVSEISGIVKFISFSKNILPLGVVVFCVTGLIVLGLATPTEAAALGSLSSIVLVFLKRRLTLKLLLDSLMQAMEISVMVFAIIAMATLFTQALAYSGVSRSVVDAVSNWAAPGIMIIIMMQLIILIMGCFMEQVAIMLIVLPMFIPIVAQLGFDETWFGIVVLLNLEIALMTPPLGLLLMIMKGIVPDVGFSRIVISSLPYLICNLLVMAVLIMFPGIITTVTNYI